MTPSSRKRRQVPMWIMELRYRFYAGATARDLNFSADMTDRGLDALEERVAALEEVIAASWPRSAVLRRRLRAGLRASVAGYAWMPPDFRRRRCEWMGERVIIAAQEGARRRREARP